MRRHDGDNHDGVLRALRLVDGGGVGEDDLVELGGLVLGGCPVEVHRDGPLLRVHAPDGAYVAVEHVLVVVVAHLHDPVPGAETVSAPADGVPRRVERLLEQDVQVGGADHAPLHGGEHLDVAQGLPVGLGQTVLDQVDDLRGGRLRAVAPDEEEVGVPSVGDVGQLAAVDGVRVHDYAAGLRLTEYPGQPHDGNDARFYDVPQHVSRAHAR